MENFTDNGMIFFNSRLETHKFKQINLTSNDQMSSWYLLELASSNFQIQQKDGIIKVDLNDVSKNNHTLILKFKDHKNTIQQVDTIDLPYFTKITLEDKNFVYNSENYLEFASILSNGKAIFGSSGFLNLNDICSCNNAHFTVNKGQIIPKYDNKTAINKPNLCLKRISTNDTIFNKQVNITYKGNYYVNFSGKNGQNGQHGVSGSEHSASGTSGTNGTNGENAPNVSVFIQKILLGSDSVLQIEAFASNGLYFSDITNLNPTLKIIANGGQGGFGGSGGNGKYGVSEKQLDGTYSAEYGGNGGNGGNAGYGGNGGSVVVYLKSEVKINEENILIQNKGGNSGAAGPAGNGAAGRSGMLFFNGQYVGKNGIAGSDANDGQNANFAKVISLEAIEFVKNYKEKMKKMFD